MVLEEIELEFISAHPENWRSYFVPTHLVAMAVSALNLLQTLSNDGFSSVVSIRQFANVRLSDG